VVYQHDRKALFPLIATCTGDQKLIAYHRVLNRDLSLGHMNLMVDLNVLVSRHEMPCEGDHSLLAIVAATGRLRAEYHVLLSLTDESLDMVLCRPERQSTQEIHEPQDLHEMAGMNEIDLIETHEGLNQSSGSHHQ
jgi:hypothetical protein